jgi:hypothetical protein
MARAVAILVVVLLAGCSGTGTRLALLDSLVDQDEQVVVQRLGAPTRVLTEGDTRILVYEQGTISWGGPRGSGRGNTEFSLPYRGTESAGRPANVAGRGCQTQIMVQDGVVRAFALAGNSC